MNKKEKIFFKCENGELESVKKLLKPSIFSKGVDVNIKNKDGNTILSVAAFNGHIEIAELLISLGADGNAHDKDGKTPLMRALINSNYKIAEFLISKGTDINAKYEDGTLLKWALVKYYDDIVKLLINSGADINFTYKKTNLISGKVEEYTPLIWLLKNNRAELAKLLIEKGADVNVKDENGNSPLHLAINQKNSQEIIELLISKGADINTKNKKNESYIDNTNFTRLSSDTNLLDSFIIRNNFEWDHSAWIGLLEELAVNGFNLISEDKIGKLLEERKILLKIKNDLDKLPIPHNKRSLSRNDLCNILYFSNYQTRDNAFKLLHMFPYDINHIERRSKNSFYPHWIVTDGRFSSQHYKLLKENNCEPREMETPYYYGALEGSNEN